MNNQINAARDVYKTDAYRVHTMQSPALGILGLADSDGKVVFYRQVLKTHTADSEFDVSGLSKLPRVEVVLSYAGADGLGIEAFVNAGVQGIIAAGLGSGSGPVAYMRALTEAVNRGVKVIIASQASSGRIVNKEQFADSGFIVADNLGPKKARILLMLALSRTADASEIQRMALTY
jgi:L-asparaginase